jgi:CRP/FNR family transcriptional regulator, cyclic AMP receptor protein
VAGNTPVDCVLPLLLQEVALNSTITDAPQRLFESARMATAAPRLTIAEIGQFALFAGLPAAALADLPGRIRLLHFGRGETLIEYGAAGSDVFLLVEGQLLAKRFSAAGQEIGFRRMSHFSYFGELAGLDGHPRSVSVIAFTDARVGVITTRDFKAMLADWPVLTQTLLIDLARRNRELSDRLFEGGTVSVPGRVAAAITRLALAAGVDGDGGVVPDMPTHAEMAALIGGQRETVTRAFNRLVDAGIVERRGRTLVIRNFEALLAQTGE